MKTLLHSITAVVLLATLGLSGCGGSSSSGSNPGLDDGLVDNGGGDNSDSGSEGDAPAPQSVRLILLGDSGTGTEDAYAVGQAIEKVCAVRGCDLVLGLGDNIYESGVNSVMDSQFDDKFELPFAPVDLPFYMVLGNHDNTEFFGGDGAGNAAGDFQVDYHYRDIEHPESPRLTDRWKMPERYYRFSRGQQPGGAPLVEFFGIDSNQVAGGFPDSDENFSYNNYGLVQAQWLKESVENSQAKWKIIFSHHPYVSNGSHGNAGNYDGVPGFIAPVLAGQRYKEFAEETFCDDADFLFSGHDHDMQWLMDTADCGKTEFIVSGAGGKSRSLVNRNNNPVYYQKGDTLGFFWVEFDGNTMTGEAYEVLTDDAAFGLGSLSAPEPSFRRRMVQRQSLGLPDSDAFTSPLAGSSEFDVNDQEGNLDPVQEQFVAGFSALADAIPEQNAAALIAAVGESGNALLEVVDSLLTGVQGGATEQNPELVAAGAARAGQALLYSLQNLSAVAGDNGGEGGEGGGSLPAPFDQLPDLLDQFRSGDSGSDQPGDLRALTDAIQALAMNIQGLVDAIEEESGMVPVIGGSFALLSELLWDVGRTLEAAGNTDTSEVGQVLVSTVNDLLNNLLLNVIPIEQFAPAEVTDAIKLGPNFLGSGLLVVVQEVTAHLDNTLVAALSPVITILDSLVLPPLFDGLAGLSEL